MDNIAHKIWRIVGWTVLVVTAAVIILLVVNRQRIVDWYRGTQYTPSAAMQQIRQALNLTSDGDFLFAATKPEIYAAEEFNQNCREGASEAAILGCYTGGQVYVYDIDAVSEPELAGIRETTTAHEMLHGAWARMSADERGELDAALQQVLAQNTATLADELEMYTDLTAQKEELYVRAGTEIRDLPVALENHFAKYFKSRETIVDFYEHYAAAFKKREAKAEKLLKEIEQEKGTLEAKMQQLDSEADQLEIDVENFNDCASTPQCFTTQAEFASAREEIVGRQEALEGEMDSLNSQINAYNAKIDEYNQNVTESKQLQEKINSKMGLDNG